MSDDARSVMVLAQEEARLLSHQYVGTEHLLLGLIREERGVAAQVLQTVDIHLDSVRVQVEVIIGEGDQLPSGHIPLHAQRGSSASTFATTGRDVRRPLDQHRAHPARNHRRKPELRP